MRTVCQRTVCQLLMLCSVATLCGHADAQEKTYSQRYATVNGQSVTRGHVELLSIEQGVQSPLSQDMKKRLIALMIDRRLVATFLDKQKVKVDRKAVRRKTEVVRDRIQKTRRETPEDFFKRILMNRKSVEQQLTTPVRWNTWLEDALTDDLIVAEFKANKAQYDGTRIRASQIFIKAAKNDSAAVATAVDQLQQIRTRVIAKQSSFAAEAKTHSQSPSGKQGGDVGWLTYVGKMPASVSAAIFQLKTGDISQPIQSPFGVHLCVATQHRSGDLSPEDARAVILRKLAEAEWARIVKAERAVAKISKP